MHQIAQVAPVALSRSCWSELLSARPVRRVARPSRAFGALLLSLAFAVPAALLGLASPAAADLGAPDRASVPAEIHASEAHALPGDATNVRIDMTENDGLDVIVAASGGGVSAPGVPRRGGRPVPPDRRGPGRSTPARGAAVPWSAPVATNQTNPTASPVGGAPDAVRRERQPDRPRHVDGAVQLARPGAVGQHAAARAVRGRHRARGVAVELGEPRRRRTPGDELGLPGARGPGGGRPLLRPGQPGWLRRLRRHLRPDVPDLPRHPVRDGDEHRRRQRHRRAR